MWQLILLLSLLTGLTGFSQNVGIGTENPHSSAKLEVSSTNSGFLPPRMTYAQRNSISNPAEGLIIYCTDCLPKQVQVYNGTQWTDFSGGTAAVNYLQLPSVTIGSQIWQNKNLDVVTYRNGDIIPQVTDATQWANLTTGAWCWYNNDSSTYAATQGRLYNWYAVNDPRGLAPQAWHVPRYSEWKTLVKYLDSNADTSCNYSTQCTPSTIAGGKVKATGTTYWLSPNTGATNSSGFSALGAGVRFDYGPFDGIKDYTQFWNADQFSSTWAPFNTLQSQNAAFVFDRYFKTWGRSVRCVKD